MTSTTDFYAFSATHPDRPAVVTPDGGTLTFGALASRVNRISHGLRSLGLAAAVHNGVEYLELVLGSSPGWPARSAAVTGRATWRRQRPMWTCSAARRGRSTEA
jgi:non-ribosomal peptide synthetase component F